MKGKDPGGMNAFSDAITSFGRHGVDGEGGEAALIIKDTLDTSLPLKSAEEVQWGQLKLRILLQKCKNLVTDLPNNDEENFALVVDLVEKSMFALNKMDDLKFNLVEGYKFSIFSYLFAILKEGLKKTALNETLRIATLLSASIREDFDERERQGMQVDKSIVNVAETSYANVYNWGCDRIKDVKHTRFPEIVSLYLESVPFKNLITGHQTASKTSSTWQSRLSSIVKLAAHAAHPDLPPLVLFDKAMTVLQRCPNVSVDDVLMISTDMSSTLVSLMGKEDLATIASRWKECLRSNIALSTYSSYVGAIIKARILFSLYLENHAIVSKGVTELVKKNYTARKILRERAMKEENTEPIKLDFDADGEGESGSSSPSATAIVPEMISLKDEKALLAPLFEAAKCLEEAFQTFSSLIQEPDYVRIAEEAVTTLIELTLKFQLHRLFYWALLTSQLAWKIVAATDNMSKTKIFRVAAIYMPSLRELRLFNAGITVLEKASERAGESRQECLFEYGLYVAESIWLFIFTRQVAGALAAICTLKSIVDCDALEKKNNWLLKSAYLRCIAYIFIREPKAVLERTGIPSSTSPLSLLEQAKGEIIAFYQMAFDVPLWIRLVAKHLYATVLHDAAMFFLWIGGPMEASQFADNGKSHAQRELSCRWELTFTILHAKCFQNRGRLPEFRSSLRNVEDALSGRSRSIMNDILRRHKTTTSGKCRTKATKLPISSDMDDLSTAASKMSITHDMNLDSDHSAESEDESDTIGMNQLVKMECFSHKKDCYCDSCVDYDLHVVFLETGFLRLRSDVESSAKNSILTQCLYICGMNRKNDGDATEGPVLQSKSLALYTLAKKGAVKVSARDISMVIEAPLIRIRLRNIANGFQSFKSSESTLNKILERLSTLPEFEIIHPDIVYFAKYLQALDIIIRETKTKNELQSLINSMWAQKSEEISPATGKSASMRVLPSTPQSGNLMKKVLAKENATPRSTTPENLPPPRFEENMKKAPEAKKTRGRPKRGKNEAEPEVPSDMTHELDQQPKVLAKRRQTVLLENIQPLNDDEIRELADKSIVEIPSRIDNGLSDGMKEAIRILSESLESMAAFPIYPSHKMMAILLLMLTGQRKGARKLASLANVCTLGKFHQVALMYYNRIYSYLYREDPSGVWAPGSKALKERVSNLSFDVPRDLVTANLPKNWIICTINCATQLTLPLYAVNPSKIVHIVVTRWEFGVEPITIYLPVKDHYHTLVPQTLHDILDRANRNQTEHNDARDYWLKRYALNKELCDMTEALDGLLGCAKGLLFTAPTDPILRTTLKERMKSLKKLIADFGIPVEENVLRILIMSGLTLRPEELLTLASKLLNRPERSAAVVKVIAFINRNPLVDQNSTTCNRSPLVLVLDNDCYSLPWESITSLRGHPVSRLPSIQFANILLAEYKEEVLKREKVYYIVNPGMNLACTEERFAEFYERKSKLKSWNGVMGKAPSAAEVKAAFEEHELIYYCGHGSGQQFFNFNIFDSRFSSANMFLSGCSSVKLEHSPAMDASGFVQQCLIMGSPCIVGNLWSVTSNCIDNYFRFVLDNLFEDEVDKKRAGGKGDAVSRKCFLELIATSRDAVGKSTYLVGAAPVLIGLPVSY